MKLPLGLTRTDVLLPLALVLAGAGEALVADVNRSVAVGTTVAVGVLLCGRRRWPVVCAVGACLVLVGRTGLGVPEDELVVPLALIFTACFALGRYADLVGGVAGLLVVDLAVHESERLQLPSAQDVLWVLTLTAGPWLAGRLVGAHVRRGEELSMQAHQLVVEQAQLSERLVADERRRLARELHDIIAHSLSVMVVQAGAASDLLRRDPDATARALARSNRPAGRRSMRPGVSCACSARTPTPRSGRSPRPATCPAWSRATVPRDSTCGWSSKAPPTGCRRASTCRSSASSRKG